MGWMSYLIDKKNKLMIPVGKSSEEEFLDDLNTFKEVNKKLADVEEEGMDFYELKERKLKNLTLGDLEKLMKCADIVNGLNSVSHHPMAYYYYLKIAKDTSSNYLDENFEIVNDTSDDYGKYRKKYKIVEEHESMDWAVEYEKKTDKKTKRK